ncbi:amidase domain-containing protein [Actinotignum sanguinis]|uniref:amidase domain-containing protein n=1 Tax=Actinotignum sanguinis TaxID=1445614 RepID=UPI000F7F05F6|nr:amidase domain-containing protein [Actinotignum sanguinis]MDY5148233.1 amidase domain-containing protein [Actinotignum sanguinis]
MFIQKLFSLAVTPLLAVGMSMSVDNKTVERVEVSTTPIAEYGNSHSTRNVYEISDGVVIEGLLTYDDVEAANEYWRTVAADEIAILESECNLPELTEDSFGDWWECSMDSRHRVSQTLWHLSRLKNSFLVADIEVSITRLNDNPGANELRELAVLLPMTENNAEALEAQAMSLGAPLTPMATRSGRDINAANAYAQKWAYGRNPAYTSYRYDCTNFVSQIMVAGGKRFDGSWKPYTQAWRLANNLAYYLGAGSPGARKTSVSSFMDAMNTGSVIAADYDGDHYYEHVGYVVSRSGGNRLIAQHTSDYVGWVIADHRQSGRASGWLEDPDAWAVFGSW